ncbi:MAG TPA: hypothetical protein VGD69_05445 [Herpetosiphonaceae bacterium]
MPSQDLYIVAWNSQGDRWDYIFPNLKAQLGNGIIPTNFISSAQELAYPTVAIITEAGIIPWISPDISYTVNQVYSRPERGTRNSTSATPPSTFLRDASRQRGGSYWVPWLRTIDTNQQNARCSLRGFHSKVQLGKITSAKQLAGSDPSSRPVVKIQITYPFQITIVQVHLTSGGRTKTYNQLNELINTIKTMIPEGTAGIIVGDINANILGTTPELPNTAMTVQVTVPISETPPTFTLSFEHLNGGSPSEYSTLPINDPNNPVFSWMNEVFAQSSGWLNTFVSPKFVDDTDSDHPYGWTVGELLAQAKFLTTTPPTSAAQDAAAEAALPTYYLNLDGFKNLNAQQIVFNLIQTLVDTLTSSQYPLIQLPEHGGIYVTKQESGESDTRYGLC